MKIIMVGSAPKKLLSCKQHSHSCFETVIVTDGSGSLYCNGTMYSLGIGDVYVIPPKVNHSIQSENGIKDIFVHTDSVSLKPSLMSIPFTLPSEVTQIARLIENTYLKKREGYSASLNSLVSALFTLLSDTVSENCHYPFTSSIRDYLTENLTDTEISMQVLSKRYGYNADYIRRCFKEDYGATPMEYLNRIRINRARDLLLGVRFYSVEEVSALCGFSDPLYFSRAFKKSVGTSPKNYRK